MLYLIYNIDASKQNVLKRVLSMLCNTSPYEINKLKLSQDTNISWATLSKYLDFMKQGDLINLIDAPSNHKRLNKPSKMLLHNPNLFFVLCSTPNYNVLLCQDHLTKHSYSTSLCHLL